MKEFAVHVWICGLACERYKWVSLNREACGGFRVFFLRYSTFFFNVASFRSHQGGVGAYSSSEPGIDAVGWRSEESRQGQATLVPFSGRAWQFVILCVAV